MRKDVIAKGYLDAIYTTYHKHLLPEEQIIFKDVVEHIKKIFNNLIYSIIYNNILINKQQTKSLNNS